MALSNPVTLTQLIGFGVFLWLGVYLLMRVSVRTPTIVASIVGLFAQAAFFASSALSYNTADLGQLRFLDHAFWWTSVLPVATWCHFSLDAAARVPFARRRGRTLPGVPPVASAVYVLAALVIVFGSATDLFLTSGLTGPAAGDPPRPGSLYPLYPAYLGLAAGSAFVALARALWVAARSPERGDQLLAAQLRLLAGGGLFFLIGALWISSRYDWGLTPRVLPGYACLIAGLAGLGYGVARFGLLLEGKNIRRDFGYSLLGIGLINLLYVAILNATGPLPVGALLWLVGLVTVTHTAVDPGRNLLDRLFFSAAERAARAEARDYATDLGTTPVVAPVAAPEPEPRPAPGLPDPAAGPTQLPTLAELAPAPRSDGVDSPPAMGTGDFAVGGEKAFKDLVRKALTGLKSPPQLAKSPLLGLAVIEERVRVNGQEDNRLNRVAALRELLIEQIDGLRPADGASSRVGDAWRFYNVLHYPYVRELSRTAALAEARRLGEERRRRGVRDADDHEQVLRWLADVDEDTYYKWQRRASDTIATALWEAHAKAAR